MLDDSVKLYFGNVAGIFAWMKEDDHYEIDLEKGIITLVAEIQMKNKSGRKKIPFQLQLVSEKTDEENCPKPVKKRKASEHYGIPSI